VKGWLSPKARLYYHNASNCRPEGAVMMNWFCRGIVIGCVSLLVLTGCRSEGLTNKLNASEQARQTEGEKNVRTVRDLYVKAITSGLPAQGANPASPKDDSPMLV